MMYQTGFPENPPTRAVPWTGDYITALFALWSSLAGLRYAMVHGRGQAIDVAQYEAIHRTLGGTMIEYFQKGLVRERLGNRGSGMQPVDSFETKDGFVMICAGTEPYIRLLSVIGLDATDPKWQTAKTQLESIEGIEFDAILRGWVVERTTDEVVRILNAAQVPCSSMMTAKDMAQDPYYRARNMHIEWDDEQAGRVRGIGIVPKFSAAPGKVWRGAPKLGQDNQRVYRELLGMSSDEIDALKRDQII
jgi:crotonobetainyl-CoA:carnitine CoA-transferase CaiB-like acyl-CoA transferase